MKKETPKWAILLYAILGFIIGMIVSYFIWGYNTPIVDVVEAQVTQCKSEHAECDVNNSNKLCCKGLVCVNQGLPSDIGKCEVNEPSECEYFNPELANLYAKDPSTWERVWGGYGQIDLENGRFRGAKLQPNTEYSLIIYDTVIGDDDDTEWPGEGYKALATGKTDECGNIILRFELPFCLDEAKIWLVLASDYDDNMVSWKPKAYLFEHDRFTTCEPEPTPTPEPTPIPTPTPEPEHDSSAEGSNAPETCTASIPEPASNVHGYRMGGTFEVKWYPAVADGVNIYYYENQNPDNEHSVINTDNDGSEFINELGSLDWTFGVQSLNGGCAGSEIRWVEDGLTDTWVLFR